MNSQNNNPKSSVKVSVCVVTYNQKEYIRECLQSIVDQETDFNFEVIVADDFSTDGTRDIVREFAKNYPRIVKPIFHKSNIGPFKNFLFVHEQATGEYVAHIDGDDFMLPSKLSIQVEELDKNQDCTVCVHEVRRFDQRNNQYLPFNPKKIPRKSDLRFLLMNLPFFTHSSKMYRAECHKDLELDSGKFLDCYLHVHHALNGSILYLINVLGVYRENTGLSTNQDDINNSFYQSPNPEMVKLCIDAIEYASRAGIEEKFLKKAKAKKYFDFAYCYLMAKDYERFQTFIKKSNDTERVHMTQLVFGFFSKSPNILFLIVHLRANLLNRRPW